jgi:IS5 family transposase
MLRDSHPIDKLFEQIVLLVPKMDPVLAKIDGYLEAEIFFQLVKNDLAKRYPLTLQTGRNSTPVEVILRMLVVKQLYGYSYEELERAVSDSLVLRQFCRVYLNSVPDDTTLIRWANLVQPSTLEQFNQQITAMAVKLKVTQGRKLRTDGTVVETHIQSPRDSQMLADSVRVVVRTLERAKKVLIHSSQLVQQNFVNLNQEAKRVSHQISEAMRKRSDKAKQVGKEGYRRLIEITRTALQHAQEVWPLLEERASAQAQKLAATLRIFAPRAEQVIDQATRRIFKDEKVPAAEKIVSIFEVHTDIIKRGKENRPVEYGHKVWFDEVDGGLISHYRILAGNPSDQDQWLPSLNAHREQFGQAPELASGDRGLYSASNEAEAIHLGVKQVILPKPGYRSKERKQYEAQDWFQEGRNWHAGVEGRISVLKRSHALGRCLNHGLTGFYRWVGWGVISANLRVMART